MSEIDYSLLSSNIESQSIEKVFIWAFKRFDKIEIAFSGAEDVILIDIASKLGTPSVFSLDTGRLHPETYEYLETVRNHYNIDIEMLFPKATSVQKLVKAKGLFSFYQDGHNQCCEIRKVEPLRKKLTGLEAWITGQRQDQNPNTRNEIKIIEQDAVFSQPDKELVKINPLAKWSSEQVWQYIKDNDVPYNPLHQKGFTSIGCQPCTRAILPNQHEREGRWWWEETQAKECGLHSMNKKAC